MAPKACGLVTRRLRPAVAVIVGLAVQGLTDTIFFRPEVQISAFFCLATLAASRHGAGASQHVGRG